VLSARKGSDGQPPGRLDDARRLQRANRLAHRLDAASGSLGDLLMRWPACAGPHIQECEQQRAQDLDAGALHHAAVLPLLAGPPVKRDGEMENPHPHVAIKPAPLQRAELRSTVIERCTAGAAANGAGDGIGERLKSRQQGPPGCSATRPEAAGVGRNSPVHAKGLAKIGEVGKSLDC
jgi:hypothetical protein